MTQLTDLELQVAKLFAETSIDCCGAFESSENLSYMNAKDIAQATGYDLNKVGGIMTALKSKNLIIDTQESARNSRLNDFIANEQIYLEYPQLKDLVTELC